MIQKLLIVTVILLISATTVTAIEIGGINIPEKLDTGQGELILNGTGIRKKLGFKIYIGTLYLKTKSSDSKKIIEADEPMALTITWRRKAPKKRINKLWNKSFKHGAGADYDSIKSDIDKLLTFSTDSQKNVVWKYSYIPGDGLNVSYEGKFLHKFTDFKFKKALFAVWLLEDDTFTGDKKLRKGMLGK
jgi:hypothetical protein